MIEEQVKIKICPKCKAEVRPNTTFCYNCGASLIFGENGTNNFASAKEELSAKESYKTGNLNPAVETKEKSEIKKDFIGISVEPEKISDNKKSSVLKPAVPKRERAKKAIQKESVTYWEEYEGKSNIGLIITAILLAVFAGTMVFFMLQIR